MEDELKECYGKCRNCVWSRTTACDPHRYLHPTEMSVADSELVGIPDSFSFSDFPNSLSKP